MNNFTLSCFLSLKLTDFSPVCKRSILQSLKQCFDWCFFFHFSIIQTKVNEPFEKQVSVRQEQWEWSPALLCCYDPQTMTETEPDRKQSTGNVRKVITLPFLEIPFSKVCFVKSHWVWLEAEKWSFTIMSKM